MWDIVEVGANPHTTMSHLRSSSRLRRPWATTLLVPALSIAAFAQTNYDWKTTGNAWGTASNWSPSGPPGATDLATFSPHKGSGSVALNPVLGADRTIAALLLGNSFTGGTFTIDGGGATNDLTVTGAGGFGLPASVTVRNFRRFDESEYTYGYALFTPPPYTLKNAGTLNISSSGVGLDLGHGGLVALGGTAVELNGSALAMHGGSLVIDDLRNTSGPGNAATLTGASSINMDGGGSLLFYSSRDGAPSSVFTLTAGPLAIGSGDARVRIYQRDGSPVATFGSLTRGPQALGTIDFSIQEAFAPNDAAIRFATAPALTNGVITAGTAGAPGVGFATYAGNDFASYDPAPLVNRVVPVATTNVFGALENPTIVATANLALTGNTTIAAATTFTANSIKITPTDFPESLTLGAGAVLNTTAILLPENANSGYFIDGGAIGGNSARYFQIHRRDSNQLGGSMADLSVSSNLGTVNQPIVKTGPGVMVLTGEFDQVAMPSAAAPITLSGGVLQARIATADGAPPINLGTQNLVQLRGGVLEVDSSFLFEDPSIFQRNLGNGQGQVNWDRGDGSAAGSGGFSAIGGTLVVRISDPAQPSAPLVWNSTPGFVRDGHALVFGSARASADVIPETGRADAAAPVIWEKNIQLDSLVGGLPYAAREIEVVGIRRFFGDGGTSRWASRAVIAAPITGSASTDLVKTGLGQLELKANNTFTGATLIQDGALITLGDGDGGQALRNTSGITVRGRTDFFNDLESALILGAYDQINDTAKLTLSNGMFITDVFSEILGPVSLANVDSQFFTGFSIMRMGQTGNEPTGPGGIIRFSDSSDESWHGLLRLENWSGDAINGGGFEQVYFGLDPDGLTQVQLDAIRFYDDTGLFLGSARILATGEIVPNAVPEAATVLFGLLPLLGIGLHRRRTLGQRAGEK